MIEKKEKRKRRESKETIGKQSAGSNERNRGSPWSCHGLVWSILTAGPERNPLPLATRAALLLAAALGLIVALVLVVVASSATVGLVVVAPAAGTTTAATVATTALSLTVTTTAATAITATTAAVASTTTASTETTTATTAATTASLGSLVNTDSATIELDVVHSGNSSIGLGFLRKADKSKSTAATGITVFDDNCFFNLAKLLKLGAESGIISVPGKAADKKLRHDEGIGGETVIFWLQEGAGGDARLREQAKQEQEQEKR